MMISLTLFFILSQIAMFVAMGFDFLSFQFKKREQILICLAVSSALISTHYFLLDKMIAGVIMIFSMARMITFYFTNKKKYLFIFMVLNTGSLFFIYQNIYDLIIYLSSMIMIIGTFQQDDKLMRKVMMVGTVLIIIYNGIIFSPMGVITEGSYLVSNLVGYYRHYFLKKK